MAPDQKMRMKRKAAMMYGQVWISRRVRGERAEAARVARATPWITLMRRNSMSSAVWLSRSRCLLSFIGEIMSKGRAILAFAVVILICLGGVVN